MSKFLSCIEADSTSLVATNYQLDILEESLSAIVVEEDWKEKANDYKERFFKKVKEYSAQIREFFRIIREKFSGLMNTINEKINIIKKKINVSKQVATTAGFWFNPNKNDVEKVLSHVNEAIGIVRGAVNLFKRIGQAGQHGEKNEDTYFENFFEDVDNKIEVLRKYTPDEKEKFTVICKMERINKYRDVVSKIADAVDELDSISHDVENRIVETAEKRARTGEDWWNYPVFQKIGGKAAQLARVCFTLSQKIAWDVAIMDPKSDIDYGRGNKILAEDRPSH